MQAPEYIIPAHGDVGIPSYQTESVGGTPALLHGDKKVTTGVEQVGQNTDLAAYTVVGRTGNAPGGALVKATIDSVTPANSIKPVGILAHSVTTGAGVTTTATVFKSGHFNADALVWDASIDTESEKVHAFEGSVAPEIQISFNRFPPLV